MQTSPQSLNKTPTDIFESLRLDHDSHREQMAKIEATEGDTPERRQLWADFEKHLTAHARAEDRIFYSEILADSTSQGVAAHSIKEHEEIEKAIATVKERDFASPHWLIDFRELSHLVRHHEEEEENGTFQVAGKVLSESKKTSLAKEFAQALKNELQGA